MREIKFRAWDSKNKIMTAKVSLSDVSNGFLGLKDNIIMQYTGLKDAINKNEIYEHDIINLLGVGFLKVEWDYKHTGWICLDKHYKKRNLADVLLNGGIRVGNIYENPDLLKKI